MPIWKNYTAFSATFSKEIQVLQLILDWIRYAIEYKLKKETINSQREKQLNITKQRQEYNGEILKYEGLSQELNKKIINYKEDIIQFSKKTAVFFLN